MTDNELTTGLFVRLMPDKSIGECIRLAKQGQRLARRIGPQLEDVCNGDRERVEPGLVSQFCKWASEIPWAAKINGDPRGYAIKLTIPRAEGGFWSNDMGGEEWGLGR